MACYPPIDIREADAAAGTSRAAGSIDWRRNLVALWIVAFVTQFGVYSAQPFLPLFIERELKIHDARAAGFWVGLCGSAVGLSLALSGPLWGRVADRWGRKAMALRATGLGGLALATTALVQTPVELVILRFLSGTVAGNQVAITALVAAETPVASVGWALGMAGSAQALGRAAGPALGAWLVHLLGLRSQFLVGSGLMIAAALPLIFLVRETNRRAEVSRRSSLRQLVGAIPRDTRRTIGLLLGVQSSIQTTNFVVSQFLGLRVLAVAPRSSELVTGAGFTAMGICAAGGALGYSMIVTRLGYRAVAAGFTGLLGVSIAAIALISSPVVIVVGMAAVGATLGACLPALNSMIGLETPEPLRATAYGAGNSLMGVQLILVPVLVGVVAAAFSISVAMLGVAAAAVATGVALFIFGREPGLAGEVRPVAPEARVDSD